MTEQEVVLNGIAHRGPAVGRLDGQVVFADYGLPGEVVRVLIDARKQNYLQGRVVEVLSPSPRRAFPPCPYFGACGGCQWQHAAYDLQLELKRQILTEQLRREKLTGVEIPSVIPSPKVWHYHNHARLIADEFGQLGFRKLRRRDIVPIDFCWMMELSISRALAKMRQLRYFPGQEVIIRVGSRTGDLLIQPHLPELSTMTTGKMHLYDEVLGRRYRISASSFFQVNTLQAERLVTLIADALQPEPCEHLLDVYGGVGTLGLHFANQVERVTIVEEATTAIEDARINASRDFGVSLIQGKAEDVLNELDSKVDCAVIDPPRAGSSPTVLRALAALRPSRIVYVSCDPATLARDLRLLDTLGYGVASLQPIDMFPQTFHLETVALLQRQS